MPTSTVREGPPRHAATRRRRRWSRRVVATAAVVALPLGVTSFAFAQTAVVTTNPGGLTKVGPVNAANGYPAWYQDRNNKRAELCLDGDNPMCGFLPGDIPDPTQPISFPDNFPEEGFYYLANSQIALPGGGKATLTLALEAAFANTVTNGDQITFARQRIFVVDGPADTTLHFHHPFGNIDIDTDSTGKGRLTEDISPAAGNFATPLKGNIGPFLSWDTGLVQGPGGPNDLYFGDPNVEHAIQSGPNGSLFSADWTDGAGAPQHLENSLFTVQGKVATNVGVTVNSAVANGNFLDVFATSEADPGELYVAGDPSAGVPSTPMQADPVAAGAAPGAKSFYARIDMTGKTMPASVTVQNIGDNPVSSGKVDVTRPTSISITDASYDGANLHVAAVSATGAALHVVGFGDPAISSATGATVPTVAPPAEVSVSDGTDTATAPVRITAGAATAPGLPPTTAAPDPGPVCTITDPTTGAETTGPCPAGGPTTGATPTVTIAAVAPAMRGSTVTLDGSATTNATSWQWTQKTGPSVTLTGGTSAKATFVLPLADTTKPVAPDNSPLTFTLTATNANGGQSASKDVTVAVNPDGVAVSTGRFRAGSEIRIDGTSAVPGAPLVLNPATSVAVYVSAPGTAQDHKLVGTSPVDTTGAWSVRLRSTTGFTAFTAVDVVSTRGGFTHFTGVATR